MQSLFKPGLLHGTNGFMSPPMRSEGDRKMNPCHIVGLEPSSQSNTLTTWPPSNPFSVQTINRAGFDEAKYH